jgi:hypothetical protein
MVLLQLMIEVACVLLTLTVLFPCSEPKLVPVIVSPIQGGPDENERPLIWGVLPLLL